MKREGYPVARCTVERLMRDLHLSGTRRARPSSGPPFLMKPSTDRLTW
jgi:transposase InsO family protein